MIARKMEREDADKVATVAASAFLEEKLYKWTAEDENERQAFLEGFFKFRLEAGYGTRVMDVAVDDSNEIVGAAIWVPPSKEAAEGPSFDFNRFMSIFGGFLSTLSSNTAKRCYKFMLTVVEAESFFTQPCWCLAPIFVLKKWQGKGVASLLMRRQLEKIDEEHLPCILVTQEEGNIPIYERFGFAVGVKVEIDTGLVSYGMIREAR
ncbi:MAG: GNAT family N-acetyltransferase [Clostridiales bacterium]|jgi:predicted N-acetyltransferase YhbS|nr:GNAT family N-acetyltransferase [Clostridiales bacterium]